MQLFIIRAPRESATMVRNSLTLITAVHETRVAPSILYTGATIRHCKLAAVKYLRSLDSNRPSTYDKLAD
jgi:RNase P/RNase MRP subunit POP5